jgi:hypothetical protein
MRETREMGSDELLSRKQFKDISDKLDLERAEVKEEERRTEAAPTNPGDPKP